MPLAMNMNYKSDEFRAKVADGFKQMMFFNGPYYIHCQEGKDRTGFVCIVIEALCGASYQELVDDYMITYDNYYGITPEKDSERYTVIVENVLQPMISSMVGDESVDIKSANLSIYAEEFLKSGGMTDDTLTDLKSNICA